MAETNTSEKLPAGFRHVTKEAFFAALRADPRDIMPNHISPERTTWETKAREVWGLSLPGWKNPGDLKVYALRAAALEAKEG